MCLSPGCLIIVGSFSLKTLTLPGNVRPGESQGAGAINFLNKLMEVGLTLTGISKGLNTVGFNICYELLTGSQHIKCVPNQPAMPSHSLFG